VNGKKIEKCTDKVLLTKVKERIYYRPEKSIDLL